MLEGMVHGADVQDRDGALALVERSCDAYPTRAKLSADGGYAGQKLEAAVRDFVMPCRLRSANTMNQTFKLKGNPSTTPSDRVML